MTGTTRLGPGFITSILIAAYGLLILLGVSPHESVPVGATLLGAGAAMAVVAARAPASRGEGQDAPAPASRTIHWGWSVGVTLLGTVSAGGVIVYNALAKSDLELPELAILAYGAILLLAAPRLGGRVHGVSVGTLVAWSLPLIAAPLGMYAFDAALDAEFGSSPLDVWIAVFLVKPLAWSLSTLGFDLTPVGQTIVMETPRGRLALSIGVVCAGIHPAILFAGVLALHAWEERPGPRRLAVLLVVGLVGVYVANLIRLVLLSLVGYTWGGAMLQSTHANAGWVVFIAFMAAYWWVALRDRAPARGP